MQTLLDVLRIAGGIFALLILVFLPRSIFSGTRRLTGAYRALPAWQQVPYG
jgi:hypothetical protein